MESRRRTCNPSWSRVKESIYDNDRQTDVRPAARRWRRTLVVVPATYSSLHNSSRGAIAARSRPDQLYPCRSNQCPSTTSCIIHRTVRSDPPCATYAYPSAAAELPRHPESQPSPEVAPTDLATLSPVSVKFVRPMIYTSNLTCTRWTSVPNTIRQRSFKSCCLESRFTNIWYRVLRYDTMQHFGVSPKAKSSCLAHGAKTHTKK